MLLNRRMLPRDFALLLLVCLVWASNFIVSKLVLADLHIPPLFFSTVRLAVVLVAVCPWLFVVPRPLWRTVIVGMLMGAGSFGLLTVGLMTASPSSVAVVVQLAVPIATLLSGRKLGERIGWQRGVGAAITFVGAITVMLEPSEFTLSVGLLFVVANAFTASLGTVMIKQRPRVQPLQFQAWSALSSIIPLAVLSALLEQDQIRLAIQGGWAFIAAAAYTALAVSVFGHTFFFVLIRKYEANLIAALTLMCPLMVIGLRVIITGDHFDARMAAGTVVVLAGVLLIFLAPQHLRRS